VDNRVRSPIDREQSPSAHGGLEGQRCGGISSDLAAPHGGDDTVLMNAGDDGVSPQRDERRGGDRQERRRDGTERDEFGFQETAGIDGCGLYEAVSLVRGEHVGRGACCRTPARHVEQQRREVGAAEPLAEHVEDVVTTVLAQDPLHRRVQWLLAHAVHIANGTDPCLGDMID
jgi:hypothetical protein